MFPTKIVVIQSRKWRIDDEIQSKYMHNQNVFEDNITRYLCVIYDWLLLHEWNYFYFE